MATYSRQPTTGGQPPGLSVNLGDPFPVGQPQAFSPTPYQVQPPPQRPTEGVHPSLTLQQYFSQFTQPQLYQRYGSIQQNTLPQYQSYLPQLPGWAGYLQWVQSQQRPPGWSPPRR